MFLLDTAIAPLLAMLQPNLEQQFQRQLFLNAVASLQSLEQAKYVLHEFYELLLRERLCTQIMQDDRSHPSSKKINAIEDTDYTACNTACNTDWGMSEY